jgi:hypothetical protein
VRVHDSAPVVSHGTDLLQPEAVGLKQLASTLVDFEIGFEILPGTKAPAKSQTAEHGPFEQDLRQINE